MRSKSSLIAGIFILIISAQPSPPSMATTFHPVSPELIGDWAVSYQTNPLYSYNVLFYIHIDQAGILEQRDEHFWLDYSHVYDRQIIFEWGLNAVYGDRPVSEWHYSFKGSLERDDQDEFQIIGTLEGTEYDISCLTPTRKANCPRIQVSGKWSAKKLDP